jgi:anthranilate phosphoribosyltransferase
MAGKTETLESGVKLAEATIDIGAAYQKLQQFIEASNA